jgi:hypothetical protein
MRIEYLSENEDVTQEVPVSEIEQPELPTNNFQREMDRLRELLNEADISTVPYESQVTELRPQVAEVPTMRA